MPKNSRQALKYFQKYKNVHLRIDEVWDIFPNYELYECINCSKNKQAEDELAKNKKEQTMRQEENQKSMESPKPGVDSGQI